MVCTGPPVERGAGLGPLQPQMVFNLQDRSSQHDLDPPRSGEVDRPGRVERGRAEQFGDIAEAERAPFAQDHEVEAGVQQRFLGAEGLERCAGDRETPRCDPEVVGDDADAERPASQKSVEVDLEGVGPDDRLRFPDRLAVARYWIVDGRAEIGTSDQEIDVAGRTHESIAIVE